MAQGRMRVAKRHGWKAETTDIQPNLVLPEDNSDAHPLMRKYAKIAEIALKTPTPDSEDDSENVA
jgi:hypothetical protein